MSGDFWQIFINLVKRPLTLLMSLVSIIVSVSLIIFSFHFFLIFKNIDPVPDYAKMVAVYLKGNPSKKSIDTVVVKIKSIGGIQSVKYVSKQEGADKIKKWLGDGTRSIDEINPALLPESLLVVLRTDRLTDAAGIIRSVSSLEEINSLRFNNNLISLIAQLYHPLSRLLAAIFIVILASSLLVIYFISRSLMLTACTKRRRGTAITEAPLLVTSMITVMVCSLLALFTVDLCLGWLKTNIYPLSSYITPVPLPVIASSCIITILTAFIGSLFAAKEMKAKL